MCDINSKYSYKCIDFGVERLGKHRERDRETLKLFGNALFMLAYGLIALMSPALSSLAHTHAHLFRVVFTSGNYRVFCGDDMDIRSLSRVHQIDSGVPMIRDGRIVFVTVFYRRNKTTQNESKESVQFVTT